MTTAATLRAREADVRAVASSRVRASGGVRGWLRGYALMVRWQVLQLRGTLPLLVMGQVLIGAGAAIGFSFLFPQISDLQVVYLSSGAAVMVLMIEGLVGAPQVLALQRTQGTYDFVWTLPVPRSAVALAQISVNTMVALPGMVGALVVAIVYFEIGLDVSGLIVPAALLVAAMSASVGYAMGHAIPDPRAVNLLANALVFVLLMYSPINFPADRFPAWLDDLHAALPFEHAANVIRAGLTDGVVEHHGRSFAILAGWTAGGGALLTWTLGRRG